MPVRPYVGTISNTPTAESQATADGQVLATKQTANMSVLATSLGFYISLSDENARFAIYDHNSGDDEPENLLGYTEIVTNSGERASPVWTFGDLNTAVYLERGEIYWFTLMNQYGAGGTGTDAWRKYIGAVARFCSLTSGYWSTFPNPFGVPDSCSTPIFPSIHAQARGNLDITPGPVARNKDADW